MAAAGHARSEVAPSPRAGTRASVRPGKTASRRREAPRRRLRSGIVWIAVTAVLLAGVVAMNVAVLQLNVRLDRLGRERAKLRAENAALASELSSAAASPRVQALARTELGLVPASPDATTYIELAPPARAAK